MRCFNADDDGGGNVNQILKDMIDKYGVELLKDADRTNALLMDYAPHLKKERKLIVMVLKEGIFSQLYKLICENEDNRKFGINKCIQQVVADMWLTENAAKYAVSILANAIGILESVNFVMDESAVQEHIVRSDSMNCATMATLSKGMDVSSEETLKYVLENCDAIGFKAFAANTEIENLTIPEKILKIYPKAFLNCINLKSIVLPKSIQWIGNCAFEGCTALEKIIASDRSGFKVFDGVLVDKTTGKALRVENQSNRDIVTIVNGITTICKKAFDCTPVRQINIPMSVNVIEEKAFFLTMGLQKFSVDARNITYRTVDGVLYDRAEKILIRYPQGKEGVNYYLEDTVEEIGIQAFACVQNLQTITFTDTLKKIGDKAFEYCPNLENLMLPGSVEVIGDRAFQYCKKLRSVMLSRSIREIGDCAFYNCISLETISVPRSVEKIGNFAFAKCEKLTNVTIQDKVSFIGDGAFEECKNIKVSVKNNTYVEAYCRTHGIVCTKI